MDYEHNFGYGIPIRYDTSTGIIGHDIVIL